MDFTVIPSRTVYSAGIATETEFLAEPIIPERKILVVVNTGIEDSAWAKAIKRIYQSEEFARHMAAHKFNNYRVLPNKRP